MNNKGLALAIIGGILGAISFWFYQQMNAIISKGNMLFGLGWLSSDITQRDAQTYQLLAIVGMVVGVILVVAGLITMMRK